jgi:glutamyl-tRNA synthetase
MADSVVTRFAPSPTGFLHIGGARTALFNWLYARGRGGRMLLRIEDTDRERSTDAAVDAIIDGLTWLGLDWNGEPISQFARAGRHREVAAELVARGKAYLAYDTPAELAEKRDKAKAEGRFARYDGLWRDRDPAEAPAGVAPVIRIKAPLDGETVIQDHVQGRVAFPNKDLDDFVVLRSDGTPIYNLAVVSDDIAMGITLVMRGDDHISNTPKQIMLYDALGAPLPRFGHLPMIHGMDGKKLSKRHGATAVGDYQHMGLLPEAMLNFLALLGWSPGGDREVMTLEEMISLFSTDGLQRKAAIFDPKKLEWMNGQHLSMMPLEKLEPRVTPAIVAAGLTSGEELAGRRYWYLALIDLLRVRARTIDDIVRQARPYFDVPLEYDPDAVSKHWSDSRVALESLRSVRETLASLPHWTPAEMDTELRALAGRRSVAPGKLFQPLRVALTGLTVSPGIFEVLVAMGPGLTLERLDRALAWLEAHPSG